jgi:hypothetical protein
MSFSFFAAKVPAQSAGLGGARIEVNPSKLGRLQ